MRVSQLERGHLLMPNTTRDNFYQQDSHGASPSVIRKKALDVLASLGSDKSRV